MNRIFLIRHGNTDMVGKRLAGRMDGVSLNKEGKAQADILAEHLARMSISQILSSPLQRTIETAQPLARKLGKPVISSEHFTEIDFGLWTNRSIAELREDPQFILFNKFRSSTRIPEGELMGEAQMRMIDGIVQLCAQFPGETMAIFSHSDLIKSVIAHFAGIHLDLMQRIEISPASISEIEIYDDTVRIMTINSTLAAR